MPRERLLTRGYVGTLALALLGFTLESILRAVVPRMVIDRGGDAAVVGLVVAVYALPSILFRPTIGSLGDSWSLRGLLRLGAISGAVVPMFLTLPSVLVLFIVRFVHGTGWAIYSVANQVLLAKIVPKARRGEASAYYMATPALATLLGPAVGITLYATVSPIAPILFASLVGVFALATAVALPTMPADASITPAHVVAKRSSRLERLFDPSALPVTAMVATFMAANALFIAFPPVYAVSVGAPITTLVPYYVVYGVVMTATQLGLAPVLDRVSRTTAIVVGCGIAIVGLASAAVVQNMTALTLASFAYATGLALVSPATNALAMERALSGRIGAAMATYSLGYQLATGLSSIAWGAIIVTFGFGASFGVSAALNVVTIALALRFGDRRPGRGIAKTSAIASRGEIGEREG